MTECEISLDGYGDDGPDFFVVHERRANKAHECPECHRQIEKGTRYVEIVGKWDGEIARFRVCLDCSAIGDALGGGHIFGEMWREIEAQFRRVKSLAHCLSKLPTVSAKNLLVERWRSWKGLA